MNRLFNLFAKLGPVLAAIGRNATLDIDTVERTDGFYLRVRVEVFGYKLIDERVRISGQTSKDMKANDVLTLEAPVQVHRSGDADQRRIEWAKDANERLQRSMKRKRQLCQ